MEPRRRAPHREGHRTTLTVPHTVLNAAERLARELGTTANDALLRLAEEGAAARERQAQIAALASERRSAVERVGLTDALKFPSAEDLRAAMLGGRHDT